MSSTQQHPTHPGKGAAAIAVSIVVGPVMIWAALICVVTIIQQVLSGATPQETYAAEINMQ